MIGDIVRGRGIKLHNEYAESLGVLFEKCPKSVFAAIAVSVLTCGGDNLSQAQALILKEWQTLYDNGIIEQKPVKEK